MKCLVCRGACCESFAIPLGDIKPPSEDAKRWVELHGTVSADGKWIGLECRCTKLAADGTCSIYDDRPLVCRLYVPGGAECLETVRARRQRWEFALIRDENDPRF